MGEIDIQMEKRNADNTEWEKLYPRTKAANVLLADGSNAQEALNTLHDTVADMAENMIDTAYVDDLGYLHFVHYVRDGE